MGPKGPFPLRKIEDSGWWNTEEQVIVVIVVVDVGVVGVGVVGVVIVVMVVIVVVVMVIVSEKIQLDLEATIQIFCAKIEQWSIT